MSTTAESRSKVESLPTTSSNECWPRIALVTPVRNSGKYIEQTILSVLAQHYPSLDYFIVDGGSTDNTLDVIRKYEKQISGWISEPDNGMYDAINKGFASTTGEVMGWISGTDLLHAGALRVVGSVFCDMPPEVEWITGRATACSEDGMTFVVLPAPHWSRYRFLAGANRYIQQESTFWRRSLWERAGSRVEDSERYAADFELWVRFFRCAKLYPVDALIGDFRCHQDSLGLLDMERCHKIHDKFIEAELKSMRGRNWLKMIRSVHLALRRIPIIRGLWRLSVLNGLYHVPGPDWPPVIEYRGNKWVFRR